MYFCKLCNDTKNKCHITAGSRVSSQWTASFYLNWSLDFEVNSVMAEWRRFKTSRGNDAFFLNGYTYRQDKRSRNGERVYWRCLDCHCTIRMETDGIHGEPRPRGPQEHNHAPRREEGLHRHSLTVMKESAKATTTPIPEIYEDVAVALSVDDEAAAATFPPYASVSSSLHRSRRSALPPLPTNLADLHNLPE